MSRLLVGLLAAAALTAADDPGKLPVKRVVLYKNGVGYFEHVGKVQGKQDVAVPFTSGQLNDVLKSLTTIDLDKALKGEQAFGNLIAGTDGNLNPLVYWNTLPTSKKGTPKETVLRVPVEDCRTCHWPLAGLKTAKSETWSPS